MRLIKEPLCVDFYFENKQMTGEDQKRVSEFIAKQKVKQKRVCLKASSKNKNKLNEC